jgi:HEAT repeat protein
LLKDSDSGVVRAALHAIANLGDTCLVEPLLALTSQQKPDFRREAVFDLGVIGEPRAISRLIELARDKDWMLRKEIIIALVNSGDWQNSRILFQLLSDPVSNVRAVAAAALGNLREKVKEPAAEKLLVTLLNDTESEVRLRAAYALGSFRNRESIQPLTVLLNDDSPDVRIAAAEALGHIGDAGAVGFLTGRLKDTDRNVRYSVAAALGMIGNDRAVQPLSSLLDDDFDSVRDAAAEAIARIQADSNDKSRDEPDDGRPRERLVIHIRE